MEQNKDFKYILQDVSTLYIGAKHTYGELLQEEQLPFKMQLIINQHLMREAGEEISIEDHLYQVQLGSNSFLIFKQLKLKVKVMNQLYSFTEFIEKREQLQAQGIQFMQEIIISKLALLGTSV